MTVSKFEEKYKEKGGMMKLTELRSLFYTQEYIAKHFGVTKEGVRFWMKTFFGSNYDPRTDKEEAIKNAMMDFAKYNLFTEFRRAFRTSPYYKGVLEELKKQNIYVNIE